MLTFFSVYAIMAYISDKIYVQRTTAKFWLN